MTKKPGYTLLELLVSVLIFSGIIILAIAAFARSSNSATRSNAIRAQVQATRSVIDQATNDLHYVDTTDQNVTSFYSTCGGTGSTPFTGVRLGTFLGCDEIELLIKYPGATGTNDLVWRLYSARTLNSRPSIYLYELRGCSVSTNTISCPGIVGTPADLIPSNYVADGVGGLTKVFDGIDIVLGKTLSVSPFIKIKFNLKPVSNNSVSCSVLAPGTCYTLDTTVIPGNH